MTVLLIATYLDFKITVLLMNHDKFPGGFKVYAKSSSNFIKGFESRLGGRLCNARRSWQSQTGSRRMENRETFGSGNVFCSFSLHNIEIV